MAGNDFEGGAHAALPGISGEGLVFQTSAAGSESIAALRAGRAGDWDRLFGRMERRCLALAWRMLNDAHLAADAVQEGFFHAFRAREQLRADSKTEAWLMAAVANAARDALRALKRNETARERIRDAQRSNVAPAAPGAPELESRLRSALAELDEQERLAFLFIHQEGLSYREVAALFAWPPGTVRSKLHRARMRLRELLSREEPQKGAVL